MSLASLRSLAVPLAALRRSAWQPVRKPSSLWASSTPVGRPCPLSSRLAPTASLHHRWIHTSSGLSATLSAKRDDHAAGVVMSPPITKKKKQSVRRAGSGAASHITMDDEHVPSLDSIASNTQIVAFSTAQEYCLPSLLSVLHRTPGYTLLPTLAADVLHIRDDVAHEVHASGELFVFADGSFVAWGTNAQEIGSRFLAGVLKKSPGRAPGTGAGPSEKLPPIEVMPSAAVEMEEMEYIEDANETTGLTGDLIIIGSHPPPQLSKLAFSHGLSRSAKIAVLESLLDRYLNSTRHIPHLLAQGQALAMSRTQILQKIGELLSVRALLNLSGSPHGSGESLLDTPEFYWSKPQLEEYYTKVTRWLDVKPRISLLNQKLDYAGEFANVLRGHLSEQHSLKLEWFIIILIAIEVVFGLVEWAEKLGYVHLTGQAHVAQQVEKTLCDCAYHATHAHAHRD